MTLITGPAEGPEGDLFERARSAELKVEVMPELVRPIRPGVDLRAYRRLRAAFRRLKPEVVHTHSSKAGILGRAAAWHERCRRSSTRSTDCRSARSRRRSRTGSTSRSSGGRPGGAMRSSASATP